MLFGSKALPRQVLHIQILQKLSVLPHSLQSEPEHPVIGSKIIHPNLHVEELEKKENEGWNFQKHQRPQQAQA